MPTSRELLKGREKTDVIENAARFRVQALVG